METQENKNKKGLMEFIKESKIAIFIIIGFVLLAFGAKLISNGYSIDSEFYITASETGDNSEWVLMLHRWGLLLINTVGQLSLLNAWMSNFLTVILMVIYSVLFNYTFYLFLNDKYKKTFVKYQFIFPILFLTNPIFAEQYNFLHQDVAVAFGIALIPISLILNYIASSKERKLEKTIFYLASIVCATIAFGVYQSIILLYILTVVSCYLIKVISEKDNNFKYLFKQIGLFAISAIAYLGICKIIGKNAAYLQVGWMNDGFIQCLRNIYYVIRSVLKCEGMFYNVGYLVSIVLAVILFVYLIAKKRMNFGTILGLVGLLAGPFYIMVLTGVDQMKRTQFNYSYVIGFMIMLFTVIASSSDVIIKNKDKYIKKIIVCGCLFISIVIAYRQSYVTSTMFYSDNVRFESDVLFANEINSRIQNMEWYDSSKDYKLIFVGYHTPQEKRTYLRGEVLGYSFFDFDYLGFDQRANIFMNNCGYNYSIAPFSENQEARQYVVDNNTPIWPDKESVFLKDENTIVVRLSEEVQQEVAEN